jgi:hypothetical protein
VGDNLRKFCSIVWVVFGLWLVIIYQPPDPFEGYENVLKDKTLIIVATMHRVGSTKIFNAVRKIYEVSGDEYYSSFVDNTTISPAYNYKNPAKIHIIKMHSPKGFEHNKVIKDAYTYKLNNFERHNLPKKIFWITAKRDLRDMVSSQVRIGRYYPYFYNINPNNFNEISAALKTNLSWYYSYKDLSDYEVSYEEFLINPRTVVEKLSLLLGKPLNKLQVDKVVEYLNNLGDEGKLKNIDRNTKIKSVIVDHHHITSDKKPGRYKDTFGQEVILKIEQDFARDLQDLGYH